MSPQVGPARETLQQRAGVAQQRLVVRIRAQEAQYLVQSRQRRRGGHAGTAQTGQQDLLAAGCLWTVLQAQTPEGQQVTEGRGHGMLW